MPIDALTGVEVRDDFEQFEQKFDIYCRAMWDPLIKTEKSDKFFEGY